jgi:ubiquinone/menaquinone biosynthesis C-methylase UbiE
LKESEKYPEFIARFYDLVYDKIRTGADHHWYLKKINEARGPVLEVGVGTGRFFTEALNQGADIYGIDISPSMIEKLKEKINKNQCHRVQVQDVTKLEINRKFELIIAPFRVFSHLIEIDEQLKALDRIYKHLKPGGIFIFDLYVPDPKMISEGITELTDFEGAYAPGEKVRRIINMKADIVNQISKVNMKFIWTEKGKEYSADWDFKMRFYFRYEIEHLIARSELKLEKIYGNFNDNELSPDSKEFIVVCRK